MDVKLTTLPNGLKIVTEAMPHVASVSINVMVNAGARNETEENNGVSHLLEHMAFKGTSTRSAKDIAEQFDNIGGQLNAYTSREQTSFYARVLETDVDLAVNILGDIIHNSTLPEDELKREKKVVLEELQGAKDDPDDVVFDKFQAKAFAGHPLGRSILGTEENVERLTREEIKNFMDRHYRPGNITISAVGNVRHEVIAEKISSVFGKSSSPSDIYNPDAFYVGGEECVDMDFEQIHLAFGFPACSYHDEDYYLLQLLSSILGGGMSSRLFQEVREKRGLAYTISTFTSSFRDVGNCGIHAVTSPGGVKELTKVVFDELGNFVATISEEELRRAKNQLAANVIMAQESPSYKSEELARNVICYGRAIPHTEILEKIRNASVRDIKRVAKRIFKPKGITLSAVGPSAGLIKFDSAKDGFLDQLAKLA